MAVTCDAVHLDLDGAWDSTILDLPRLDLRPWGPRFRHCARRNEIEEFYREVQPHLVPMDLYVRHTNLLLNALFKPVLKLLQPTRGDPTIRKFPNAKEIE